MVSCSGCFFHHISVIGVISELVVKGPNFFILWSSFRLSDIVRVLRFRSCEILGRCLMKALEEKKIFHYKDGERDVVVLATLHSLERQKGF